MNQTQPEIVVKEERGDGECNRAHHGAPAEPLEPRDLGRVSSDHGLASDDAVSGVFDADGSAKRPR